MKTTHTRERRPYKPLMAQEDDVNYNDVERSLKKIESSEKKKKPRVISFRLKNIFLRRYYLVMLAVTSIAIYFHEFIMLGYSMVMFNNGVMLRNGTHLMQKWDLHNIIMIDDKNISNNVTTTTKVEFINNVSSYAPPPKEDQPIITRIDSQEKLAPFLVNPYLSLPGINWKNYCTFHPAPQFDKINVIDFTEQGILEWNNPWHCINEYPCQIWCVVTALYQYSDYQYDILLPKEYNNRTWCAQLLDIIVSRKRDNELQKELPKHTIALRRSWYEKLLVSSNFFTFDVNQKKILEYSYLQQAVMGDETSRLISSDDRPVIIEKEEEEYAVFIQRKKNRKMVDSQTYYFDTVIHALKKKGGIPRIKIVYFEDINLAVQIEMVSRAKLLIGAHGAGLMNMLWLPKHAGIVEVLLRNNFGRHDDEEPLLLYHKGDYFNLAKYLDLSYRFYDPAHIVGSGKERPISMNEMYMNSQEFADLVTKFWFSL